MSINRVNTGVESFNFLTNQSSILHTVDINKITVNGVNVIVDKPKRGDVMCITKYKENGNLLEADKQKVIWIDGLSINPKQLSTEYEPVGICIVVNGNKALVLYRQQSTIPDGEKRWAMGKRWELPNSSLMNDGVEHSLNITWNGTVISNPFVYTSSSRKEFVDKLNQWFRENNPGGWRELSAELVELDTDLPATDTSDTKDGNSYRNRVIVNASTYDNLQNNFKIDGIGNGVSSVGKQITPFPTYFLNSGFRTNTIGGACRAKYYDYIQTKQVAPTGPMTSINKVPGGKYGALPVRLVDFNGNDNCQILRDNFATYDEYLESNLIKSPCGVGVLTEDTSGKENTYKLADCTYLDIRTGKQKPLYSSINWAASIGLNAPKLGKGNWWLPSAAEMCEIMRDITYGTTFWATKPDIINSVIAKLKTISPNRWSMLSASSGRWTSSRLSGEIFYYYNPKIGSLSSIFADYVYELIAITIYEF